jgi:hypothetical protein
MLKILTLMVSLGLICACSSEPAKEEMPSSCAAGDCAKNLNKLGAQGSSDAATQPMAPKAAKKKTSKQ